MNTLFLCDRKKECAGSINCQSECFHTMYEEHAKNLDGRMTFIVEDGYLKEVHHEQANENL